MKFHLTVDRSKEESVTANVHCRSAFTEALEELVRSQDGRQKLAAFTEDGLKWLCCADVECITVLDGKTFAIDRHGTRYRLKQRLYELEQQLPACFIRINKSALANENRIDRFVTAFSGAVDAVFMCGYREYVSRRCFAAIKRRFEK